MKLLLMAAMSLFGALYSAVEASHFRHADPDRWLEAFYVLIGLIFMTTGLAFHTGWLHSTRRSS